MRDCRSLVIAIDGPVGSGKSTAARELAQRLGLRYLDSGALYRAITWKALRDGIRLEDGEALAQVAESLPLQFEPAPSGLRLFVNGEEITEAIRRPELTRQVYHAARNPRVRSAVNRMQCRLAGGGGVVAEGRDITTVVFPEADVKFFLTASPEERARRRHAELTAKGISVQREEVLRDLLERDRLDSTRAVAPLRQAEDARVIDTTNLSIDQMVQRMVDEVNQMLQSDGAGATDGCSTGS